jgi:hypothetical protein
VDLKSQYINFTTTANSTFYFDGIFDTGQPNQTITFATGNYFFNSEFYAEHGTITFGGGTVVFNQGFKSLNTSLTQITFGPGIYYILNGTLDIETPKVTVNGATFIFENQANYFFSDQGDNNTTNSYKLYAPSNLASNSGQLFYDASCVTNYTVSGVKDNNNGHGICNLLFYKPSSDTMYDGLETDHAVSQKYPPVSAADAMIIDGIISENGALLDFNYNGQASNGTIEADSDGFFEIECASLYVEYTQLLLSSQNSSSTSVSTLLVQ